MKLNYHFQGVSLYYYYAYLCFNLIATHQTRSLVMPRPKHLAHLAHPILVTI